MSRDEHRTRDQSAAPDAEPAAGAGVAAEAMGGEPACMLDRVCPECGRLADATPPTTCARCGARVGDPD